MTKLALLVRLESKPGKEKELQQFLESGLALAREEKQTITWYAIKINESTFGIFDTFQHEDGRLAHLSGKIAKALMEKAPELLANDPKIEFIDVLAAKLS
ncbi:MAG TPA: antibiotic biosynthesis monooxygenase [Cytophagaceae bacterium]